MLKCLFPMSFYCQRRYALVELREKDNVFYSVLPLFPWVFYTGQVECCGRWEHVRIRASRRMWNYFLLTLDSGPSCLLVDFWHPKEGHSPRPGSHWGPMLSMGVQRWASHNPCSPGTPSLVGRSVEMKHKEVPDLERRNRYQDRLQRRRDIWAEPVELTRKGRLEEELVCKGTGALENPACSGSCKLEMNVREAKWREIWSRQV